MRTGLAPGLALIGGAWALVGPWLFRWPATTSSGMSHMGAMSGTTSSPDASFLGVALGASVYYWHIVPGVLAIILALALGLATMPTLKRVAAAMLAIVAIWTLAGPWVLPLIGLGSTMTMGLGPGTLVRHVVPGGILLVAAILSIGLVRRPRASAAHEHSRASGSTSDG